LKDEKEDLKDQGAIVRGGEVFKDATHDCHNHAELPGISDNAERAEETKEDEHGEDAINNDTHNREDEYDREGVGEEGPDIPGRDGSLDYAEAKPLAEDSPSTLTDRGRGRA